MPFAMTIRRQQRPLRRRQRRRRARSGGSMAGSAPVSEYGGASHGCVWPAETLLGSESEPVWMSCQAVVAFSIVAWPFQPEAEANVEHISSRSVRERQRHRSAGARPTGIVGWYRNRLWVGQWSRQHGRWSCHPRQSPSVHGGLDFSRESGCNAPELQYMSKTPLVAFLQ